MLPVCREDARLPDVDGHPADIRQAHPAKLSPTASPSYRSMPDMPDLRATFARGPQRVGARRLRPFFFFRRNETTRRSGTSGSMRQPGVVIAILCAGCAPRMSKPDIRHPTHRVRDLTSIEETWSGTATSTALGGTAPRASGHVPVSGLSRFARGRRARRRIAAARCSHPCAPFPAQKAHPQCPRLSPLRTPRTAPPRSRSSCPSIRRHLPTPPKRRPRAARSRCHEIRVTLANASTTNRRSRIPAMRTLRTPTSRRCRPSHRNSPSRRPSARSSMDSRTPSPIVPAARSLAAAEVSQTSAPSMRIPGR
jgi:hypothetical protein